MSTLSQFFGGSAISKQVDILLVGGGGGTAFNGGGGGAGRYMYVTGQYITTGASLSITIGAGGAKAPPSPSNSSGTPGSASSIISNNDSAYIYYRCTGGGAGGEGVPPGGGAGDPGGSGGGGGNNSPLPTTRSGGVAYTELINTSFMFDAGNPGQASISTGSGGSGGGGGAGGQSPPARTGGAGIVNNISGSPVTYAAGGTGLHPVPAPPGSIAANTGNGAIGGGPPNTNTPGSSGVCIMRWPTEFSAATSVTGNDPTLPVNVTPGYYTYRWNGDGSITI